MPIKKQTEVEVSAPAGNRVRLGALNEYSSGGFMPEGDYELLECRFVEWNYGGKAEPTLAFKIKAKSVETGEENEQYYSVGNPQQFQPDENGTGIIAVGSRSMPSSSSNWALFLSNLYNAGFPQDKFVDSCAVFDGMVVHFAHIPEPRREGLKNRAETDRVRTVPVPQAIVRLPWEKAAGKAAKPTPVAASAAKVNGKVNGKAAPAPAAEADGDSIDVLKGALEQILADNPDGIERTRLRLAIHKATRGNDAQKEVMELFAQDDTLGVVLEDLGFQIDGTTISPV